MKKAIFVLASLILLAFSCSIQAMPIGITTAQNLNVRSAPGGDTIDTLPDGSVVGILDIKGEWVNVMYLKGASTVQTYKGWVHIAYLQMTSGGTGQQTCETEYKSGAKVCLSVGKPDLDCDENFDRTYYDSCEVTLNYDLQTDYRGQAYIDADVSCKVEVSYEPDQLYIKSDSDRSSNSHSLYANGSDSGYADFSFQFSSFDEVRKVEIDSAECRIDSVNLW